jgi:hypothetical protein
MPHPKDYCYIELGTPNTIKERIECLKKGQPFIQVPSNIAEKFAIGTAYNSAFDLLRE